MIKLIYDCKLGTQDLFIALNNEVNTITFQENSTKEEAELYEYLKSASDEDRVDYVQNLICGEELCDMLINYFSQNILRSKKFVDAADVFDITNIRIIKSNKRTKDINNESLKAAEVMNILHITRPTLCKYVKQGLIRVDSEINGKYKYNRESVYALLNK